MLATRRRACGHVDVGTCPHQVLAATLTLSQPGGADYAHHSTTSPPGFSDLATALQYEYLIMAVL